MIEEREGVIALKDWKYQDTNGKVTVEASRL